MDTSPPTEPPAGAPARPSSGTGDCPPLAELETVAAGGPASALLSAHVARCRACADRLDAARFGRRFAAVMADTPPSIADSGDPRGETPPAVPGYRVMGELSRGGQGVVYRAEQIASGQSVAIKVLHPSAMLPGPSRVARARFLREIQIVASMHHPGIVGLLDSLTLVDGRDALIMEFVDGLPLDGWLGRTPPPSRLEVLLMLGGVAEALHHAHQKGVIHRDLKPSNILVDFEGRPRLLDFGVARRAEGQAPADRLTRTGEFTGTLAYAAPEQVMGDTAPPDVRTDVYALGIIGYQALTGRLPYAVDGSLETTIRNITTAEPPNATQSGLDLDAWTVIAKAMSKEPSRRYQSAAELTRDFRAAAVGEAIDARRDSRWYVLRKSARRHRLAVSVGGAVFAGLLAVLGSLAIGNARLSDALRESNLRQLHAHIAAGARARAETILWPALHRAVPGTDKPEAAIWEGSLRSREMLWAFVEMQGHATCLRVIPGSGTVPLTIAPVRGGRFGVVFVDRTCAMLSIDGATVALVPGPPLPESVISAWYTPDGARVIALMPGEVRCVDATEARTVATAPVPPGSGRLSGLVTSSWGVAVSSPQGGLRVLSIPDLATIFHQEGLPGEQRAWLDARAPRVGFFGADSALRIADLRTGEVGPALDLRVPALAWSVSYPQAELDPEGRFAAAAHASGLEVAPITAAGAHPTSAARLIPRQGQRVRVSVDPTGSFIGASAYGDSTARLWRTSTWEPMAGFPGHDGAVLAYAFSDDGSRVLTADSSGTLRLWATPDRAWRHPVGTVTSRTHDLAMSPDGATLYASDASGVLRAFALDGGAAFSEGRPLAAGMVKAAVSGTTGRIAVLGTDDRLELIEPETTAEGAPIGRPVRLSDAGSLVSARFRPGFDRLGVVTQGGLVAMLDGADGAELSRRTLETGGAPSSLRFGPRGDWISITRRDGRLELLDPDTLETIRTVRVSEVQLRSQAVSPDGSRIACAGDSGRLMTVDPVSGRVRASEPISENSLFGVAFHPGGSTIVTGDRAGLVFVLDAETLRCLATFDAGGSVMSLAFAPDGGSLFVAALDRPVERWDFAALAATLGAVRPAIGQGPTPDR